MAQQTPPNTYFLKHFDEPKQLYSCKTDNAKKDFLKSK